MNWIAIVVVAHFLNAINFVIDKFLLSKIVKESFVYTFAIGVLGLVVLFLIPLGFEYPGFVPLLINLITGACFILALTFFFRSLQMNEASRIVPLIGSAIPVFTLIFSFIFLQERLQSRELWAFFFLLLGTYVITKDERKGEQERRYSLQGLGIAFLAALFFSISFVLSKYIFETQSFWSGFIWIRLGSFLAVLVLLSRRAHRKALQSAWINVKTKMKVLFVGNQIIGALAFLLLSYSIDLASVTLVNALQGVQYAILLVLAVILSLKYPKILSENISRKALVWKGVAVMFIGVGLLLLA